MENTQQPVVFIIFGGTGDLNWRKINPALYNLYLDGYFPKNFAIINSGRRDLTDDDIREKLQEGVNKFSRRGKVDKEQWSAFAEKITYQPADIMEDKSFQTFGESIKRCEEEWGEKPTVIFYMSVAAQFFSVIAEKIKKNKLAEDIAHSRIVIEKPFGHDLESSRELNNLFCRNFDEKQIYRIDHYLGKEAVQNIMAFRFANAILEPLWNRNYIEHVQISVSEQIGVGSRGGFYEGAGALRDMVQNHILQLLCLVGMEAPVSFDADEIRNKKVDVLRSMRRFKADELKHNVVRGQYGEGWVEGEEVKSYREEGDVDPESSVETFAAVKFFVDNWRWFDVPFYVRTGKRMPEKSSVITIQFRDVPHKIFPVGTSDNLRQNRLVISIQPDMSIRFQVQAKTPGVEMALNNVDMVFDYDDSFGEDKTPEAYETLLLDTMTGDQTLYMRGDQVEEAWKLLMPVLDNWESKTANDFPNYAADTWGPEAANALLARDGYHWFTLKTKKSK
jgi:glucose-6-phosphate 1-dehydrogenase